MNSQEILVLLMAQGLGDPASRPPRCLRTKQGSSQEVLSGPSPPSPSLHTTPEDRGARERLGNKGGFHPELAEKGQPWRGLQPQSRVPSCDSELKNV